MNELVDIAKALLRRRRYRNLSIEKVEGMLSRAELTPPPDTFDAEKVLLRIKRDMKSQSAPVVKGRFVRPVLAAAAVLFVALSFFLADDFLPDRSSGGQIALLKGEAYLVNENGKIQVTGTTGLAAGGKVVTGAGSSLDIFLGKEVVLHAGENTQFSLKEFRHDKEVSRIALSLDSGSLIAAVRKKKKNDSVVISTDNSITEVRGTLFSVTRSPSGKTRINLFEGKLEVKPVVDGLPLEKEVKTVNGDDIARLTEGESCLILPSKTLRRESAKKNPKFFVVSALHRGDSDEQMRLSDFFVRHKDYVRHSESLVVRDALSHKRERPRIDSKASRFFLPAGGKGDLLKVRKGNVTKVTSSGRIVWRRKVDVDTSLRPRLYRGNAYLALSGGRMAAISLTGGKVGWTRKLDGSGILSFSRQGNSFYVATEKNRYYRIHSNGSIAWTNNSEEKFTGFTAFTEHLYFVTLEKGKLLGFDRTKGIKVIRKRYKDGLKLLTAWKNNIYIVTGTGRLISFDYRSDEILWRKKLSDGRVKSCIASAGGLYVFLENGDVLYVDNSGHTVWKREVGSHHVAPPVIEGKKIYVLTRELFVVLNRTDGTVAWTVVVPPVLENNLALTREKILFYSHRKGLHILKK